MKSDAERGTFAAWLRQQRLARGWKEAQARERLQGAADAGVSFSTYRDLEAGNRKPTTAQREAIVRVFGDPPQASSPADATPAGLDALVALQAQLIVAFEAQAKAVIYSADSVKEAVTSLVEEIRQSRADDVKALREELDFAHKERQDLERRVAAIEHGRAPQPVTEG